MPQLINLDTFEVEDDGENEEMSTIIDLDTGELSEIKAKTFGALDVVEAPAAEDATQDVSGFRPAPDVDASAGAFGRNVKQGMMNMGGGILRAAGEAGSQLGIDGSDQFLKDLEVSQSMEQNKTDIISADDPIKSFAGEVLGETIGFPVGAPGKGAIIKGVTGAIGSGAAGGFSAAGRNEDASGIALDATLGAVLDPVIQAFGGIRKYIADQRAAGIMQGTSAEVEAIETAATNLEQAIEAQANTGIRTLPAQKTLDPFQLESQSFIGQNPEVSTKAYNVLKNQNREAADAVTGLLDAIASPTASSTVPSQARKAAGNIVSTVELMRAEASSPIYKQAMRRQRQGKTGKIDTSVIETKADKMAAQFDDQGQVSKNIKTLLGKVSRADGDLSKLHNAKLEIDQMIDGRGDDAIGNTTKRFLVDLQTDLVDQMVSQSPSYRAARDLFRQNSQLVDEVRGGVFGRIAEIQDKDLKRVSGVIFDATESNPTVVLNSIRALKNVEGGRDIASGLLRTEIEKRLGGMKSALSEISETGGRKLENAPANLLNTFFGNAKQKRMLMSALEELNPDAASNARWLEQSLSAASSGRPGGSQTGIRAVITEQLRGVGLGIRNFFRSPIDSIVGIGEEAAFSRKVAAFGDALYNPDWTPDMKRIKKLKPSEAASEFEKLLNTILKADDALGVTRRATTTGARIEVNDLTDNEEQQ